MKPHKAAPKIYKPQYHIVWVTGYRCEILVEGGAKCLRVKTQGVREYYPAWHFTEIGIDKDHVHMHISSCERSFSFCTRCIGITAASG